jgi:outer membrane cobalamin receptor
LRPFQTASSILSAEDSLDVIKRTTVTWGNFSYLGDLLWEIPGVFIRDLGSAGQPSQLTLGGLGWHETAVFVDGRIMNEALTGTMNLNLLPLEAIQRIEYQTGARAFLYGLNSTDGALNIITQNFNTNRPYSRIRYSEDGYGFTSLDGIFSQNFTRRFNLATGFQHQSLDGRFPNSNYDGWNVRLKLRYLLSDRANLVLSEIYNQTEVGLNGGVDLTKTAPSDVFDELRATMVNTDSYEKVHRHDITATMAYRWLGDSSVVSSATAYYSHNLREYRDEENRPNPNGIFIQSNHTTAWYGMKLNQDLQEWGSQVSLGAEIQKRKVIESPDVGVQDETDASLTGKMEFGIPVVKPAVFARYDHYRGESFGSYGADVKWVVVPGVSVFGGYSTSYRTPTIQELYWRGEGLDGIVRQKEKHELVEVGILDHASDMFEFRASFFHRRITNMIVAYSQGSGIIPWIFPPATLQNVPERTLSGLDGRLAFKAGPILGGGTWTLFTPTTEYSRQRIYPEFSVSGEIAYRQLLFQDHLDLKVGLKGKFFTSNFGELYNPETMVYVENGMAELNQQGSADFFVVGKIGSAYVHFMLENITDEQYMLTPFYPMPPRKIRFGIEWEFLD